MWDAWVTTPPPVLTDIPVAKAQLYGRAGDYEPSTAAWLAHLGSRATWRAVRCARTGHVIHCVSDRTHGALTADLRFGLRLMSWMSRRPLTWYWWDHEWDRVVPANTDPSKEHVNGGWAVPGVLEVHVYRREEAHKVMLHECVHALGLDVPMQRIPPVLAAFEADLGRRLWPHLGEALTELLAEWLWAIARSRSLDAARSAWTAQMECSEGQAAAVWARIYDSRADEETNVFAYYVLKWVLMGHLDTVLLNPDRTLDHWFAWWQEAKPHLRRMAQQVMYTEGVPMSMGMTCPTSSPSPPS